MGNHSANNHTADELQALRISEERYRHISRLASDYAYIYRVAYDLTMEVEWVSDAFMKMTGFASVEEVLSVGGWRVLIHPDDLSSLLTYRERLLAGETVESDYRVLAKNGEAHWVHNIEQQIGGPNGKYLSRVAGASHEITARKLAEDSLREKEERLRMALDAAHMSSWEWTPSDDGIVAAPMFLEMLQGRPATRESFLQLVHPDDREVVRDAKDRAVHEGTEYEQEFRLMVGDGRVIWLSSTARPFYDEQGQCDRLIGVVQEITERKQAEAALSEQQARLRLALEAAEMSAWEWRLADDTIVTDTNHLHLMGAQPATRSSFQALLHAEDRERVKRDGDQAIATRSDFSGEFRVSESRGEVRWFFSHGRPLPNALGEVERLIGVTYEITERKKTEEMLREGRDQLRTLSRRLMDAQETERRRIARELHDETGQALTAVKLNLQSLKRHSGDLQLGARLEESIKIVEESLNSIRNISHELRPSILDDLGLVAALRWYVDRQSQRAEFTPHFHADVIEERLPTEIETACFRIVQEALTNIIRHAAARNIWVELLQTPHEFRLLVRDDGIGFNVKAARDFAAQGHSLGILGMQERAQLAGGQFELKSGKRGGAEVRVRFAHTANLRSQTAR